MGPKMTNRTDNTLHHEERRAAQMVRPVGGAGRCAEQPALLDALLDALHAHNGTACLAVDSSAGNGTKLHWSSAARASVLCTQMLVIARLLVTALLVMAKFATGICWPAGIDQQLAHTTADSGPHSHIGNVRR